MLCYLILCYVILYDMILYYIILYYIFVLYYFKARVQRVWFLRMNKLCPISSLPFAPGGDPPASSCKGSAGHTVPGSTTAFSTASAGSHDLPTHGAAPGSGWASRCVGGTCPPLPGESGAKVLQLDDLQKADPLLAKPMADHAGLRTKTAPKNIKCLHRYLIHQFQSLKVSDGCSSRCNHDDWSASLWPHFHWSTGQVLMLQSVVQWQTNTTSFVWRWGVFFVWGRCLEDLILMLVDQPFLSQLSAKGLRYTKWLPKGRNLQGWCKDCRHQRRGEVGDESMINWMYVYG